MSCQLEFFVDGPSELDLIKCHVKEVKDSCDKVRKSMFARANTWSYMSDYRSSRGTFVVVKSGNASHFNPNAIFLALYLVASDRDSFVAICLVVDIPCDNSTNGIHDVFEAHGVIVESVKLIGCESGQHDFARHLNFITKRFET